MTLFKPDYYICHSNTTRNSNGIVHPTVLLPQFTCSSEIKSLEKIRKNKLALEIPRILTYRSYAKSPRLLPPEALIQVAQLLGEKLTKKVQFYIIDPLASSEITVNYGYLELKIIHPMPRSDFLNFLASSTVYLETSVDEEIGLDSIEAGLLNVPLAKVTYNQYVQFQNYTDAIIVASSPSLLAEKLLNFLTSTHESYYGKRFSEYIFRERSWDAVKPVLLNRIRFYKGRDNI